VPTTTRKIRPDVKPSTQRSVRADIVFVLDITQELDPEIAGCATASPSRQD